MSPSNMLEDSPIHVDHILAIEATVDDMRSQNEATYRLLQDVLNRRISTALAGMTYRRPVDTDPEA